MVTHRFICLKFCTSAFPLSFKVTTLKPEIGKLMYEDYKQISIADLPGLIEGAHMNKGMGHKFLKHVERTRQLLFVVDVGGFQLASKTPFRSAFEAVQLLTKELELYKEEILSKPALLVVNKMDLPDAEENLEELKEQLQNPEVIPAQLEGVNFTLSDEDFEEGENKQWSNDEDSLVGLLEESRRAEDDSGILTGPKQPETNVGCPATFVKR
ncbi:GTP-binding protein 10-like isoform 1-T2 [Pholidichthys leucotaenia]